MKRWWEFHLLIEDDEADKLTKELAEKYKCVLAKLEQQKVVEMPLPMVAEKDVLDEIFVEKHKKHHKKKHKKSRKGKSMKNELCKNGDGNVIYSKGFCLNCYKKNYYATHKKKITKVKEQPKEESEDWPPKLIREKVKHSPDRLHTDEENLTKRISELADRYIAEGMNPNKAWEKAKSKL